MTGASNNLAEDGSLTSVISVCHCRICQTAKSREELVSPCNCKGSLGKVHLSCLERWLNMCGRQYCEICRFQFQAVRKRRYGICQSIRVWIRHPRHGLLLRSDLIVAIILTLVTVGLAIVCLLGMKFFVEEGLKLGVPALYSQSHKLRCRLGRTEVDSSGESIDHCHERLLEMWGIPIFFWPGLILMFLSVIMLGYVATLYLMAKDHILPWYRWWSRCMIISIILTPKPQPGEEILQEDEHHCVENV